MNSTTAHLQEGSGAALDTSPTLNDHSLLLRDYLGQMRAAIEDGQQSGQFRQGLSATTAAKVFFGALDEMATSWILSNRRRSLESDAAAVVDIFLNGTRAR